MNGGVLDVGCGDRPRGDVNCDLYVGETPHIEIEGRVINSKNIPNFVQCDAHFLPFRNSCFSEVHSCHLFEHVKSPARVLEEMLRVTKDKVTIVVPHRYARRKWMPYEQCTMHKRYFNVKNIADWLERFNLSFDISVRNRGFPSITMPLIQLPWEITVKIKKATYFGK